MDSSMHSASVHRRDELRFARALVQFAHAFKERLHTLVSHARKVV